MLFDTAAAALDWLGVIVFAISGALVASRKQMDVVGFALLGTVTGIGGGSLRDLLLGLSPVFWVRDPLTSLCACSPQAPCFSPPTFLKAATACFCGSTR